MTSAWESQLFLHTKIFILFPLIADIDDPTPIRSAAKTSMGARDDDHTD